MSYVDGALEYARIRAELQAQAEAEDAERAARERAEQDARADREYAIARVARELEQQRCLAWLAHSARLLLTEGGWAAMAEAEAGIIDSGEWPPEDEP